MISNEILFSVKKKIRLSVG